MSEVETLVTTFSRSAFEGNAAWFLGAGAAKPAGFPGWAELLKPLAESLGIILSIEDDLPAIAQYIVNFHSGNRGPLIQHMRKIFNAPALPTCYHRAVARSGIGTIWTTNYDELMEQALSGIPHQTRFRETDLADWSIPSAVELIKMHGSIKGSSPDELVIATSDYEDFVFKRPAMTARLHMDLLRRSFLFVGYGYNDPNIKTALAEARRLAGSATQQHWLIQRKLDPKKDSQKALRQELWAKDLRRIGISCVLLESYSVIEALIERISIQSRGPTVYVTGSHTTNDPRAAEIGQLLAVADSAKPILLDGQSSGVSRTLSIAFQTAGVNSRTDLNKRLKFFPNPYSANPSFSNDPTLMPMLKEWRAGLLRKSHTVLAFDGGMGTEAEIEIARDLNCRIIPVPQRKSGYVWDLLDDAEIRKGLDKWSISYVDKARDGTLSPQDVANCVLHDLPRW